VYETSFGLNYRRGAEKPITHLKQAAPEEQRAEQGKVRENHRNKEDIPKKNIKPQAM
jgi:hypothetical protein